MNDNLKIQVLMIYYQHWGNEQNKIRKSMDAIEQFQELYQEHGFMMRMSCRSYLKRHKRRTWYYIMDILLKKFGGGFQPIDMLPESKNRLQLLSAQHVILSGYNDLMEDIAISVDAIVALM